VKFTETRLQGAYLIEPERVEDERGFFARTYCHQEFEQHGIEFKFVQCNISFNQKRGTLRGMHYQAEPHAEAKLVRCTSGAIFDVIADLRLESPTYRRWHGFELSAGNRLMVYAPQGFAHGFQTLANDTEVFYQMSHAYHAESARGIRWDDPALGVRWPLADIIISERDRSYLLWTA
jgi:dTDP-4-dehydrorhamnose 3,5-epimerase